MLLSNEDDNKSVIIVGAGITGLTLAQLFANKTDKRVLIIEMRDHIGGNCYDFVNSDGVLVSKYGPHIFHTNNEKVWNYIKEFAKWEKYEHKVLGKLGKKFVPIPVNTKTINILLGENLKNIDETKEWVKKNKINIVYPKNGKEAVISKMGNKIYEKVFKCYTKKQWGLWPSQLEPEILLRVPLRFGFDERFNLDKYQVRPIGGFTKMFEQMIDNPKIEIRYNTNYFDVLDELPKKSLVIFTGPINEYVYKMLGYKMFLPYRSINLKFKTYNKEYFQQAGVVNYLSPKEEFTRITEYKYLTGQKMKNKTTISWEYGSNKGIPCYPILTKRNIKKYQNLEKIVKKIPGVFMAGRLGTYKYLNMDTAIAEALECFEKISYEN